MPTDAELAMRQIGVAAHPAAQMVKDMLAGMRRVLREDKVYLSMLKQIEGWIIGERCWLAGVGKAQEAPCMRVEHSLLIAATCPVNGAIDDYACTVRCPGTIPVEEILAVAQRLRTLRAYQEDITQTLADALGCEVETLGTHSGVKTRVICHARTGERPDGGNPPSGVSGLTQLGLPLGTGERQQHEVSVSDRTPVGS